MRCASGESSTRTQDTLLAHLWFTTGLRHHETDSGKLLGGETVMAAKPFEANGRSANRNRRCVWRQRQEGKHAKGKKGKDKRAVLGLRVYCGHSGKWRHKQIHCRYKNAVAEVDEEESVEPPNSSASNSTTPVAPPPLDLSSAGTAQSTTGTISTLMEAHARQGEELRVGFAVVDVKRPIPSVSRLMDRGMETFIPVGKQILRR